MSLRIGVVASIAIGMAAASPLRAEEPRTESSRREARSRAEAFRAERLMQAAPIEIFSPFYSVGSDDQTLLVALNTVNDPVTFDLAALSAAGEVLPLGRYSVEPSRHLALVLRDLVRPAGRHFFQGSLRLSFLGDTGTLQAWVVVRRGRQAIEISCQAPSEVAGSELTAFWDSSGLPGRPAVYLLNAGNRNVRYNMASGGQPGSVLVSTTIAPGERHRITPPTAETRG